MRYAGALESGDTARLVCPGAGIDPVVFALGLLAALLASALFNIGLALQALEARDAPARLSLRLSLLTRLLRRPRWLLGWVLGIVGIGPQVLALALAPFVAVQPTLAIGLLLLLWIGSRKLGEHVGAAEVTGVVAIIVGVALVAAGAPQRVEAHRGPVAVIGVVAALAVPSVLPFVVRGSRIDGPWLVMLACGTGFAATNIATKLMSDDVGLRHLGIAAAWAGAGIALGAAATITNMTAFQRCRATVVVPVTTMVQTFLPIVLEPLFLREHWGSASLDGSLIVTGLVVALAGTGLVARARSVSELVAGAQAR